MTDIFLKEEISNISDEKCIISSVTTLPSFISTKINKKPTSILKRIILPKPESLFWQKSVVFTNPQTLERRFSNFGQPIETTQYVISGETLPIPQLAQVLREFQLDFHVDSNLTGFDNIDEIEKFFNDTVFKNSKTINPQIYNITIQKKNKVIMKFAYFRLYSISINRTPFGIFNDNNNVCHIKLGFKEVYPINEYTASYVEDIKGLKKIGII